MAVTHQDFQLRKEEEGLDVSSQKSLMLMVFSVLCGFASFVLCLAAEATHSEATWFLLTKDQSKKAYQCYYSSSGRTPLACAGLAFLALAIAMFIEHAFILMTIGSRKPPALVTWSLRDQSEPPASAVALRGKACALFVGTWVCFAIAEVLLMIGISVEASHLKNWNHLRSNCVITKPGLFASAGVFGLATVFLAAALYLIALKAQRLQQLQLPNAGRTSPQPEPVAATGPSTPSQSDHHHLQQQQQRSTLVAIGANRAVAQGKYVN